MKAFDPSLVNRKLAFIDERLNRLLKYKKITIENYVEDPDSQAIVERNLEVLIQAAADTNRYILVRLAESAGNELEYVSNADSFLFLAEAEVLPEELATELSASGKFRNVLAHLYDEILPQKTIDALAKTLQYYPDYIEAIQSYLNSLQG